MGFGGRKRERKGPKKIYGVNAYKYFSNPKQVEIEFTDRARKVFHKASNTFSTEFY